MQQFIVSRIGSRPIKLYDLLTKTQQLLTATLNSNFTRCPFKREQRSLGHILLLCYSVSEASTNKLTSNKCTPTTNVLTLLVHPHGQNCHSPTSPVYFGRRTRGIYSLFRNEPSTDDFVTVNSCCVLLVNRIAVGLHLVRLQ